MYFWISFKEYFWAFLSICFLCPEKDVESLQRRDRWGRIVGMVMSWQFLNCQRKKPRLLPLLGALQSCCFVMYCNTYLWVLWDHKLKGYSIILYSEYYVTNVKMQQGWIKKFKNCWRGQCKTKYSPTGWWVVVGGCWLLWGEIGLQRGCCTKNLTALVLSKENTSNIF